MPLNKTLLVITLVISEQKHESKSLYITRFVHAFSWRVRILYLCFISVQQNKRGLHVFAYVAVKHNFIVIVASKLLA